MHRWKFSVLAAAAAASVGLYAPEASALALGRIHIQSALGEPLRAEIELPDITSAEAETLQASTASPDVFKAQGMEYSGSLNRLQYRVVKRPNGTSVLRVTSDRPVNDPFVDLVLDATWSAGRIVRSYTMLLDPPALRKPSPTITAAPKVSPSADTGSPAVSKPARTIATRNNTAAAPTRTKAAEPATAAKDAVKVKTGDTASRIANAYKPSSVSLDQMLVAMLRANPDAFVKANVNQLKAGAILQLPDDATAAATPPSEARQIVAAQSKNFNTFRRNLAATAPETQASNTGRTAAGTVQTQVDDKTPSNAAPDKLTVTKATIQGSKTAEDTVVKDRQAEETASRITELSKNIADLHKLSGETVDNPAAPPADAGAKTPPTPAVTVGVEGSPPPTSAEDPSKTAAAGPDTNTAATPDSAPAATPSKAPESPVEPPAPAPAPQETGFLDGIFENPLIPIGSLAALLLFGFGAYRFTQGRKNAVTGDSSFLESRIQQDSFFGASGGQQIDTTANSDLSTGSSMAYTPSQLEAGGDVDPVAEADVYLAYNRDLQAEEILKEAIRQTPNRISAHVKLAEIYAKRQDKNAFEVVAGEVFKLTQGDGSEWQHVVDMGHALDPANALYQPGGQPSAPAPTEPAPLSSDFPTVTSLSGQATDDQDDLDLDLDLDLDFNLHDDALTEAPNADLSAFKLPDITPPAVIDAPSASVDHHLNAMDLDFPTQAFTLPASNPTPSEQDYQISKSDALEFDLGGLSLDLDVPSAHGEVLDISTADELVSMADDPLATKLALAEEFMMIGDTEGARSYFEEVIAEASGPVKAKAQKLLKELS